MNLKILGLLIFSLISLELQATNEVNVGVSALEIIDESRMAWDGKNKRPVLTHIFYETTNKDVKPLMLGEPNEELFHAGNVVWNAKPASSNKKPLIIMSHGTGGSALQMVWIANSLVNNGYIVVGVNHHGNTAIESKKYAEGFKLWWERTRDLSVVLNKLSTDELWSKHIDNNRIGVIGFSLGGYTAISAIGGITDKSLFVDFCNSNKRDFTCDAQIEFSEIDKEFNKVKNTKHVKESMLRQHDSYKIEKIKAAFILAPAVAQVFTKKSLLEITVPVSVVVGSNDKVAPAKTNAQRISSLVKGAVYSEVKNAGHYTFLSSCTKLGLKVLKELCNDHKNLFREKIHSDVGKKAVDFFNSIFMYKS